MFQERSRCRKLNLQLIRARAEVIDMADSGVVEFDEVAFNHFTEIVNVTLNPPGFQSNIRTGKIVPLFLKFNCSDL